MESHEPGDKLKTLTATYFSESSTDNTQGYDARKEIIAVSHSRTSSPVRTAQLLLSP